MLLHQRAIREVRTASTLAPVRQKAIVVPSRAARNQGKAIAHMNNIARQLSSGSLDLTAAAAPSPTTLSPGSSSTPTAPSSEDLLARDLVAVQKELEKWNAAGLMTKAEEIEEFDLVLFWQVSFYNYLFDNQH